MRIIYSRLHRLANGICENSNYTKTKPYPSDSVHFTGKLNTKQSIWKKLFNIFGQNLNPKSFSDSSHSPKGPYVASKKSVELSLKFAQEEYLSETQTIIDGFRDGGRQYQFTEFGDTIFAYREVITIDRKVDKYLANAIEYAKEKTKNLNEQNKVKTIYKIIHSIGGDFEKSEKRADILAKKYQAKDVLLGEIFAKECATCRHKALMFKILADECGLKTRVVKGLAFDLGGYGKHAWNEVKLTNGKKLLVDIQNSRIVDLSSSRGVKKVTSYCDPNLKPYYE